MLKALAALLALQFAGELFVRWSGLPLPGPLLGMALLFIGLLFMRRVPDALERMSTRLFRHMMLFFIPLVAGVTLHVERVAAEWLPFVVACIAGSAVTLVVTALVLQWALALRNGRQS